MCALKNAYFVLFKYAIMHTFGVCVCVCVQVHVNEVCFIIIVQSTRCVVGHYVKVGTLLGLEHWVLALVSGLGNH